jgi:hypothetical protein
MQTAVREVTCDIQAAHQHAVDSALALYVSTPKFGAVCDTNLYKKKLVQVKFYTEIDFLIISLDLLGW